MDESSRYERTKPTIDGSSWPSQARLLVFWDGGHVSYWLGDEETITVGRSRDCNIHIDHISVSRVHARICGGSNITIEDLGSSNGVRMRGVRVAPHMRHGLQDGDTAEVGSALVVLQRAPNATGPQNEAADRRPLDQGALDAMRLLELVAPSDLNVVFLGETGVGKSFAAEDVHRRSRRTGRPFVKLNCAALPDQLLESELFGYERGAFTGALKTKPGLLEHANGGTVLLDEIAEMPTATQAKLLSAIEDKAVMRLGGLEPRAIDVRFLAATNSDLLGLVAAGTFRKDLYFRLNGVSLTVPPLRARSHEIPAFANAFLREGTERMGRDLMELSVPAVASLVRHAWPGNLRELRAVVELAIVLCRERTILPEHLRFDVPRTPEPLPPRDASPAVAEQSSSPPAEAVLRDEVQALEKRRVTEALEKAGGNQTTAAKLLGISRHALIHRLTSFGLPRPRKGPRSE